MKRYLVLAILVFVLGCLGGCGGNKSPFDPAGDAPTWRDILETCCPK